jgi:hypothetical protein
MTSNQRPLKYATGDDLAYLEKQIETLELRSEVLRQEGKTLSAAGLMQATRHLRQQCPPTSHVHDRVWNNGDLFPVRVAVATRPGAP